MVPSRDTGKQIVVLEGSCGGHLEGLKFPRGVGGVLAMTAFACMDVLRASSSYSKIP